MHAEDKDARLPVGRGDAPDQRQAAKIVPLKRQIGDDDVRMMAKESAIAGDYGRRLVNMLDPHVRKDPAAALQHH